MTSSGSTSYVNISYGCHLLYKYYNNNIIMQGSWVKKIMDQMYNVEKSRKHAAEDSMDDTPRKRGRPKSIISLASRYPSLQQHGNDNGQQQQHIQAIFEGDGERQAMERYPTSSYEVNLLYTKAVHTRE